MSDLPDEDLLSHVAAVKTFVDEAVAAGGNVLVHCFRGRSRSAALVVAYLMQKHACSMEKAFRRVLSKRDCVNPHDGFMAQLKLYEIMNYGLDNSNLQVCRLLQQLDTLEKPLFEHGDCLKAEEEPK